MPHLARLLSPKLPGNVTLRVASVPARDEVFQVAQDWPLAAQVELDPAADRELDLGLLVAERDAGDDREAH